MLHRFRFSSKLWLTSWVKTAIPCDQWECGTIKTNLQTRLPSRSWTARPCKNNGFFRSDPASYWVNLGTFSGTIPVKLPRGLYLNVLYLLPGPKGHGDPNRGNHPAIYIYIYPGGTSGTVCICCQQRLSYVNNQAHLIRKNPKIYWLIVRREWYSQRINIINTRRVQIKTCDS